jgi:hypothetical protein
MKKILILLVFSLLLIGCRKKVLTTYNNEYYVVKRIKSYSSYTSYYLRCSDKNLFIEDYKINDEYGKYKVGDTLYFLVTKKEEMINNDL